MKLELGCGESLRPGFVGCDIRDLPNVKYVCAPWDLSEYIGDESVDHIYSRHFFEHLTFEEGRKTLLTSWKILKCKGTFEICLPDLRFHLEQLMSTERRNTNFNYHLGTISSLEHAMAGLYGWQRHADTEGYWDVHKSGYDQEMLEYILKEHGFDQIKRIKTKPYHLHLISQKS